MTSSQIHQTEHAQADGGMTLVELLVVLVILALAYAMAVPSFRGSTERVEIRVVAEKLAGNLRAVRASAIGKNQAMALSFDAINKTYRIDGSDAAIPLPSRFAVTVVTARETVRGAADTRLLFFPDGGSSGGRITLGDADRTITVAISWLTGQVTIEADAR